MTRPHLPPRPARLWVRLLLLAAAGRLVGVEAASGHDPLGDIEVVQDEESGATYYLPVLPSWPRPEIAAYPVVVRSASGGRTLDLRVALEEGRKKKLDSFALRVDGEMLALDLRGQGRPASMPHQI